MKDWGRYVAASGVLMSSAFPVSRIMSRCYGQSAGDRFRAGMMGTIGMQQALVGIALWRSDKRSAASASHRISLVDMLTLSRGCAAALLVGLTASGVRDRRGRAGWMGWVAILYGAIVCDWLDGPIARHLGTSQDGALLDLEIDSWLTLCAAGSAVTWGELPVQTAAAPLFRYLFLYRALREMPYADVYAEDPSWVRHIGIVQMLLFIAALAPFGGRATRFTVRLAVPIQTPLQLGGLVVLHRRRRAGPR